MARDENPPFQRGQTFHDGATPDAATITQFANLEGKEWVFEDVDYSAGQTGVKKFRTGRPVRCRVVRNVSGVALLPKRLVSFSTLAYGRQVDGYATVTAAHCYPVDEFLPAAGVVDKDLFYIVVDGPAIVLTALDGGADNVINVGDRIVSLTAATSGATTAGRVASDTYAVTQQPLADATANVVGRALTAATTANTNTGILIDCGKW